MLQIQMRFPAGLHVGGASVLGSLIAHLHVHGMTVHSLRIHCILHASTHTAPSP